MRAGAVADATANAALRRCLLESPLATGAHALPAARCARAAAFVQAAADFARPD